MARQLPAVITDQRSSISNVSVPSTTARVLAAVAPDVIRMAERAATARLAQRQQSKDSVQIPDHTEAFHMSEVQIDTSIPFVRRVTMRKLTAWNNNPVAIEMVQPDLPAPPPRKRLRKAGLVGASGLIVFCAGMMARRLVPFPGNRETIIDVSGKPGS